MRGETSRAPIESLQGRRLTYTYSRTTRHAANAKLTEQLAALAGPGFERVHLTSGGSEAVEMALKFLRQHAVANGQPERECVTGLVRPSQAVSSSRTCHRQAMRVYPCRSGSHLSVGSAQPFLTTRSRSEPSSK